MPFKGRRPDRPKQTARKTTGGLVGAYSFAEDEDEDLEQDDDEDEEQEVILAHSVCSAACDTGPIDTAMRFTHRVRAFPPQITVHPHCPCSHSVAGA